MDAKQQPRYRQQLALNRLLDLAQAVLEGKEDVLIGAYKLLELAVQAKVEQLQPFSDRSLYLITSECDNLPIFDDFRSKCSPEYLQEKQPAIDTLRSAATRAVLRNCRQILENFIKSNLEDLEVWLMINEPS